MIVQMNPNVQKVVEFLQREIPADELNGVANAIPAVAAVVWSEYHHQAIRPMKMSEPPITESHLSLAMDEQQVAT